MKLKLSIEELEKSSSKWGMKINDQKCKIISVNYVIVKKVNEFKFWGSVIPRS